MTRKAQVKVGSGVEERIKFESLKSTKWANVVTAPAKNEGTSTRKAETRRLSLSRRKMIREH